MRDRGYNLIAVDGVKIVDLLEQKKDLYCYETESWGLSRINNDLTSAEGLYFLGFDLTDGVNYTYADAAGGEHTFTYYADDFIPLDEYRIFNNITETESKPFVYYELDTEKSLAVLTLTSCVFNEEYRNRVNEMFTEVKEKGIENIAVDIRDNGGGNSQVANEFIRYLDVDLTNIKRKQVNGGSGRFT